MNSDPAVVAAKKIWDQIERIDCGDLQWPSGVAQIIREAYATTLAEKDADIERLLRWVNDLHSGMYINCVYCGHRYGPRHSTPDTMAEVLRQHVEQCPKHPMSLLKAERDRLAAEVERLKTALRRVRETAMMEHVMKETGP